MTIERDRAGRAADACAHDSTGRARFLRAPSDAKIRAVQQRRRVRVSEPDPEMLETMVMHVVRAYPLYEHECERCRFLGHFHGYDLYTCGLMLNARYGDEPEDVASISKAAYVHSDPIALAALLGAHMRPLYEAFNRLADPPVTIRPTC